MKWLVLIVVIALFGLNVHAYDYPTKILYLRDLGTKYTGQIVSFTAEIITISGQECIGCKVWFYVDGPNWNQAHWIGPAQYSDYAESGLYTVQWKIPIDASEGTYSYWARVQDSNDNIMSADSNEYTFRVIRETMRAKIISLWPIDDVKAGSSVSFWAHIQNTADKSLDLDCNVKFYVRATIDEDYVDYYAGSRSCTIDDWSGTRDVLNKGETRWFKVDWTTHEAGKYTYWATVEYENREISETTPTYSFNVLEPRSAFIETLDYVDDARTGSDVYLGALVENTADITLGAGCRVAFWVKGPQKGGQKMEGFIGYSPCDQTDSMPQPLYYREKRWYAVKWKPPMAGEYTYQATVQYKERGISNFSSPQSFRVGDDVTTTTTEPEQETIPETIPPTTEPLKETTTTQEETTTTISTTTTSTETEAPKITGQVTGINLGSPLISFIVTVAISYCAVYIGYKILTRNKKETKNEGLTPKQEMD